MRYIVSSALAGLAAVAAGAAQANIDIPVTYLRAEQVTPPVLSNLDANLQDLGNAGGGPRWPTI